MKIKWGNILAFLLVVIGVAGYFQWERLQSLYEELSQRSRAATEVQERSGAESVIYARDSWITGGLPELGLQRGYHRDYKLSLVQSYYASDDDRLKALAQGRAHFSEISFPSLLYNAEKFKLGDQVVVLGFIDYSRGGDGVIVRQGIKTVNDLVNKRVGFVGDGTGKYMLSFLLRMVDLRFEDVKGVAYTDEAALAADFTQGKLDAIAYWQPGMGEVLKAVPGAKVLLSTADMPTLIPDVLIANRKFVAENPVRTEAFLKFWFATVKHVQERPDMAFDRWADALNSARFGSGAKAEPIYGTENTAAGLREIFTEEVRLVGLEENLKLMGLNGPGELEQMVRFAVENWNRVEDLKGLDARQLFQSKPLAAIAGDVTLKVGAIDPARTGTASPPAERPKEFSAAADPQKLDEVAHVSIPNIEFDPDATTITAAGRKVIETVLVPLMKQFPNFYLLVDGHTDVGGDNTVLTRLSQGRADAVKRELVALGFSEAQVIARGFGDRRPLFANPKTDAEKAKNRRTEFRLLRDPR